MSRCTAVSEVEVLAANLQPILFLPGLVQKFLDFERAFHLTLVLLMVSSTTFMYSLYICLPIKYSSTYVVLFDLYKNY